MVRFKNRYILCKLEFGKRASLPALNQDEVYRAIRDELQILHGEYAMACARKYPALAVHYLNKETNLVMIRCARDMCKKVQSSLPFVKKLGGADVFLNTIHLAGTIRSCMKFIVRYHKTELPLMLYECKTEEERLKVHQLIVASCSDSGKALGLLERQ
ncbi:ribonuclease P/MRP protein subunit POP5-like [Mya arenaria]|uniref:ribonuclease P/MRP protein subunit POP5-like n=1 Tax=Mya arenaria TaxID=6604 RepID=UPI0022E30CF6|nr:ribonuclease P/MRP protein subunit POP5-like [Mya arenaria]